MKHLNPLRPLLFPVILLLVLVVIATNIPLFTRFDTLVLTAASKLPRDWMPFLELVSHLGDYLINIVMIMVIVTIELIRRQYNRALIAGLALAAFPLFFIVKESISRARPVGDFIIASGLPGYSFPSGHAVTSAVAFGLIAILIYSTMRKPWKFILPGLSLLLIVVIGFSRVYLGAHFPTDVAAGWLLALFVLSALRALSIFIAQKTHRPISDTTEDEKTGSN